jgi:hypothetical protein
MSMMLWMILKANTAKLTLMLDKEIIQVQPTRV